MNPIDQKKFEELTTLVSGMIKQLAAYVPMVPTVTPVDMVNSTADFLLNKERVSKRDMALLYSTALVVIAGAAARASMENESNDEPCSLSN